MFSELVGKIREDAIVPFYKTVPLVITISYFSPRNNSEYNMITAHSIMSYNASVNVNPTLNSPV